MTDQSTPDERDRSAPGERSRSPIILGVSLKLYLDIGQSVEWSRAAAMIAREHAGVRGGAVRVFVLPSLTALGLVSREFDGTRVDMGAQDLHWEDRGAFTGAISGADLRDAGCRFVEVGHAERRRLFGDDDDVVRAKLAAAVRNRLTPVLCIGEHVRGSVDDAVQECLAQLESALSGLAHPSSETELIVAYEPEWAIGGREPASAERIESVVVALRRCLRAKEWPTSYSVIYGGSAQLGVLSELGRSVDGLFLGRFAHDPADLARIIDEAAALR